MKKFISIFVFTTVYFVSIGSLFAGKLVVVEYPTAVNRPNVNSYIATAVDQIIDIMNENGFVQALGNQPKMAQGFGNASAISAGAGNLVTDTDIEYFSLGFGLAFSGQLPSEGSSIPDKFNQISTNLDEGGDAYFGFGWGVSYVNLTIPGKLIAALPNNDKFQFWTKFGWRESELLGIEGSNKLFGFGTQYFLTDDIVKVDTGKFSIFKIRPVTINTGITYISNEIFNTITLSESVDSEAATVTMTNVFDQNIKSWSFVVPVEVASSVNIAYFFNIFGGLGFDMVLGKTSVTVDTTTTIDIDANNSKLEISDGVFEMEDSSASSMPSVIRPKLFFGVGIDIYETVIAEISTAYYPFSGLSVGLAVGASF